jgi:hypothetical protein
MTTYEIVTQGSPIIPYNLLVKFPIDNMQAVYKDPFGTALTGQDLQDMFEAAATGTENAVKTQPFFSIQDTSRNVTWQETNLGPNANEPEKTDYSLAQTFTINDAEVSLELQVQSDLTGQDLEDFLQLSSENKRSEFMGNVPWTPIV